MSFLKSSIIIMIHDFKLESCFLCVFEYPGLDLVEKLILMITRRLGFCCLGSCACLLPYV